jgi:hypothetical protein
MSRYSINIMTSLNHMKAYEDSVSVSVYNIGNFSGVMVTETHMYYGDNAMK